MAKIRGTNFGSWLIQEKWMMSEPGEARIRHHWDTYITEEDFREVRRLGLNMIRLPVPCQVFGDRQALPGCIDYVDKAMDWAEKNELRILLDLCADFGWESIEGSGRIYAWHKDPEKVEYVLKILEKLAERYAAREGLFGIEVPSGRGSRIASMAMGSPSRTSDPYVPLKFLKSFYMQAYMRIRSILPEEKVIVFHDGYRTVGWKHFFETGSMKNVMLDTHIYLSSIERLAPLSGEWIYRIYMDFCRRKLRRMSRYVPVIIGEWCICNKYADRMGKAVMNLKEYQEKQKRKYRKIAIMQLKVWEETRGWFYWNYRLLTDPEAHLDEGWKESLDLTRCIRNGWVTRKMLAEER